MLNKRDDCKTFVRLTAKTKRCSVKSDVVACDMGNKFHINQFQLDFVTIYVIRYSSMIDTITKQTSQFCFLVQVRHSIITIHKKHECISEFYPNIFVGYLNFTFWVSIVCFKT